LVFEIVYKCIAFGVVDMELVVVVDPVESYTHNWDKQQNRNWKQNHTLDIWLCFP